MRLFNKITIIGVGLIGGSIGLAVKKRRLAKIVWGVGRRMSRLKKARRIGAVDKITLNLREGIRGADLVIIATPISLIPQYALGIASLSGIAKKGLIVTDAGSTKDFVVLKLEKILPERIRFVGSHPFAGSEKSGIKNACGELFCDAKVFLTPTRKTDKNTLRKISRFWKALGSEVVIISPKRHDELMAGISHLPHIVAASLVNSAAAKDIAFASTGFSDTTRIAAGDPVMWRDICLSNSKNITKAIKNFQKNLEVLSKAVKNANVRVIMQELGAAKRKRENINI